jgi:hypothetical protein
MVAGNLLACLVNLLSLLQRYLDGESVAGVSLERSSKQPKCDLWAVAAQDASNQLCPFHLCVEMK